MQSKAANRVQAFPGRGNSNFDSVNLANVSLVNVMVLHVAGNAGPAPGAERIGSQTGIENPFYQYGGKPTGCWM